MVTVSVVVSVVSVLVAAGAFFVFIPVFVQMNGHGSRLAQLEILVNETVVPGVDNATEARHKESALSKKNNNIRALLACKLSTALLGIPLFRIPSLSSTQGARRLGTNLFVSLHRPSAVT